MADAPGNQKTTDKVENWAFPLKVGTVQAIDPQQYYRALAKAEDGFYPIGTNGLWHGGVHFDDASGLVSDKTEVRCIADGEVVAYRIDKTYPVSEYGSKKALFSTGFVLVRHRLELPAAPPSPNTTGMTPASAPAAGPSLTFFSLYMHLLDWQGYQTSLSLTRPVFWRKTHQVKATASEKLLGLRVRNSDSGGNTPILAVLPRGTTVFTKPAPDTQKWLEVVSVSPVVADLPVQTGWVFKGEMQHLSADQYFVGDKAKDVPSEQKNGAIVRDAFTKGRPIGFLPAGTQIKISDEKTSSKYRKLLEIVSGESMPVLVPDVEGALPGYVSLDLLETMIGPEEMDKVVSLEVAHKVMAGDLLGHVGKYQNQSDSAPKNLLHLEVFSCEDVKTFIQQSRSRAANLPAKDRTLVKVSKGAKLISHVAGMNATTPPKASDPGHQIGYDLIIPLQVLELLPPEKKIKAAVVIGGLTTYTYWWHLEGVLADVSGNAISGWFAEPDTALSRHSPFEWEGFTFIEETVSNVEHYAAFLHGQKKLTEEELSNYQPEVVKAGAGPVTQSLYKILDKNGDKKLLPDEIREVLSKPWFSQPVSQMVTKYESEWDYQANKWDSLDELNEHSGTQPNKNWAEEKARIERLSWWGRLAKDKVVSEIYEVSFINSVAVIGSFFVRDLVTYEQMKKMFPLSVEGKREEVRGLFNKYADRFEINTPARISQFFAQVKAEVGDALVGNSEDLWYSVEMLKSTFKRYFDHYPEDAENLGYKRIGIQQYNALAAAERSAYVVRGGNAYSQLPKPDEIAKRVYCCNSESGGFVLTAGGCSEGLSYKGKGFIQLTWRGNYQAVEDVLRSKLPDESFDIVNNPDQLLDTKIGFVSAMGFWEWQKINSIVKADEESTDKITKVVNSKTDTYAERRENFSKIYKVLNE
ncbi:glycoside hydrolase family 19 protein [Pseudomonas fluorescens]|uniref:glycoside hydrolase family 19 protein n=1 Tax=Pseudomonas fluorescens TaxID=294 RepID=UPI000641AEC1|nr:hypothetical protein [Pseudomonas fluorescens]